MTALMSMRSRHTQIKAMASHHDRIIVRCPIKGCIDLHLHGPQAPYVAVLIRNSHRDRIEELEGRES